MTSTTYKSEVRDSMRVDWDVPIEMDDGLILRADIFRPNDDLPHPVLLSYGPYGKGLSFQEGYPSAWNQMVKDHPDTALGSSNLYQNWEVADPEKWVPDGYICVRVDSRGAGRSPGQIDHHSKRETRDLYLCIEWAGQQAWSNGKVGLAGISYYATNQWRVAALKPPHLAAICVWEGYVDRYRDSTHHGGILCTFVKNWQDMQVKNVQHGVGTRGPVSKVTGELVCGPDTLDEAVLAERRVPMWSDLCHHHLDDAYYHERTPVLENIEVPLLSCGNWGGHGLHNRGNVEGFVRAGSKHKWLEMHGGAHWAGYYTDYGLDIQKRFLDQYLKGVNNGWESNQPRVQLQIRHVDHFELRHEHEWPIARTVWTPFHLHADGMKLSTQAATQQRTVSYRPLEAGVTFSTPPMAQDTEITGPSALKLFIQSASTDADIFAVLRVFDPPGKEVVFQGALDPHTPIGQGWLRASHRKLDARLSRPYRPYHTHDEVQPLVPGQIYELDVEIWATSIVVPKGHTVAISVLGKDYEWDGPAATLSNMKNPMRGCGPFIHDEASDRPSEVFGATVTVLTGGDYNSHLLLPVIPKG
ncbi:MAG: CocE/NonD family hydrolase [Alphaproteobacteria bacterium]|nr:CocE/NonD family hydrolase [Alphaproteobacteria bacterium]